MSTSSLVLTLLLVRSVMASILPPEPPSPPSLSPTLAISEWAQYAIAGAIGCVGTIVVLLLCATVSNRCNQWRQRRSAQAWQAPHGAKGRDAIPPDAIVDIRAEAHRQLQAQLDEQLQAKEAKYLQMWLQNLELEAENRRLQDEIRAVRGSGGEIYESQHPVAAPSPTSGALNAALPARTIVPPSAAAPLRAPPRSPADAAWDVEMQRVEHQFQYTASRSARMPYASQIPY
jgi:hypothetical protein